jgi:hypothetical protein
MLKVGFKYVSWLADGWWTPSRHDGKKQIKMIKQVKKASGHRNKNLKNKLIQGSNKEQIGLAGR